MLNLDLHCYKLRSGQKKDTKHVGFISCNCWRQLYGKQLWPFEVNLLILGYDLRFISWKYKDYNTIVTCIPDYNNIVTLSKAMNADEWKNLIKSDSIHLQLDISYCSQYWALDWFQNGNIKLKSLQVSLFYHYFLLCKITFAYLAYCSLAYWSISSQKVQYDFFWEMHWCYNDALGTLFTHPETQMGFGG